jgi:hypothetical protein
MSLLPRTFLAVALAAGVTACDDPGPTAPVPDVPVFATITSTYSGTLARNGAITFPFAVAGSGTATATLNAVGPDNTVSVGLTMGIWNGAQCVSVIANDNAREFAQISGAAGAAGTLCLRIYDVGRLSDPITFTIAITHPGV